MTRTYPGTPEHKLDTTGLDEFETGTAISTRPGHSATVDEKGNTTMNYGIGGILVLILVILAIIYFAKRV